MMKVNLTDDEVRETLVALRVAGAAHAALLGMAQSKEVRGMLLAAVTTLAKVERKLGGGG